MNKKRALLILLGIGLMLSLWIASPIEAGESGGWKNILPKKDLKDWSIHPIPPTAALSAQPQWSLDKKTGYLFCSGKGGHDWLRLDRQQYRNFILQVEWRFVKQDTPVKYNSGIFVRNNADGSLWHQVQTGDSSGGFLFGVSPGAEKPERFNTQKQSKSLVKPAGEWNSFEITCQGNTISVRVNGETSIVWDKCGLPTGYVGLEAEGFPIEFKTMRIKKLKE